MQVTCNFLTWTTVGDHVCPWCDLLLLILFDLPLGRNIVSSEEDFLTGIVLLTEFRLENDLRVIQKASRLVIRENMKQANWFRELKAVNNYQ